jgi:hypothetical protein
MIDLFVFPLIALSLGDTMSTVDFLEQFVYIKQSTDRSFYCETNVFANQLYPR